MDISWRNGRTKDGGDGGWGWGGGGGGGPIISRLTFITVSRKCELGYSWSFSSNACCTSWLPEEKDKTF